MKRFFYFCAKSIITNTLSEKMLIKCSKSPDYRIRRMVVDNPRTPIELIIRLSKDEKDWVRQKVASSNRVGVKILARLSKDQSLMVRKGVLDNPKTTGNILTEMVEFEVDSYILQRIARHKNTPAPLLTQLSMHDEVIVRREVASNSNTKYPDLRKLLGDMDEEVRSLANKELLRRRNNYNYCQCTSK